MMIHAGIKHIVFLCFVFSTVITTAQVTFEAKLSKTKLGANERLRIDFEMNKDGDNFSPPDFADFKVIGGPNTSVSNLWVNGVRSYSKVYSYFLAPKAKGKFTIGAAAIEIDGEVYKTQPVTVQVTNVVQHPNDPDNVETVASDNIHLVAEISKTNPYLNEAITVVYKLYVSQATGARIRNFLKSPKYNDFWSHNVPTDGKEQNVTYKGENYRYVVLQKTVLYPQKTGKLEIEPLSLDVVVEVPTNRRTIFGGRLMKEVDRILTAGSKTINVKPLPEANKPANFTGAVGDYNFKVTASKTELDASESLQLQVEVTGNGNLKLFNLPKVTVPSSLEIYEPEHSENLRTDLSGTKGNVVDSYTIVPQYKGKYPIPSISFSYFDLKTESYKQIASDDIVIEVLKGPSNLPNSEQTITTNTTKQKVHLSNDQFAYVKTQTDLAPKTSANFFKSGAFWGSLLLPLLAIPLALVFKREKEKREADVFGSKIRAADKLAKKYLGKAKKSLGNKEAFYVAMEKALHNYLKAKLQIETSEFSKDKIEALLLSKNINQETVAEFLSLLKNCELARYTPLTNVEMQQDYEQAAKTISVIDKQMH